ncbi:hypothetical protein KCTC32516_01037 [Polaribacter huanghezhanensis]|uniref:hypothetical protein n=1 Tax=Polaribacter huanghezhanensis TaxID=1354726 RepID=UPI0026470DBE|nr:hypothetical protein [Polaribacter huanghezhanensis]WKD85692.1 hypothetical protein KCTC32516_01037 [Polaribacter huanghezhanensis]
MKKQKIANYLKTGILFLGMILVLNSCQKEELSLVDTTVNNLEKVKKMYAAQFNKSAFTRITSEPLWEKANVHFSEDGQYIEIPYREVKQKDLEKSTSMSLDHLVASVNSSGEVELNIVHYFAQDIKNTNPNFEQLNYYDTDTFHGFITKYDLNKNVIAVNRFINGIKTQGNFTIKDKKKNDLLSRANEDCLLVSESITTEYCMFWYNPDNFDEVEIIICNTDTQTITYEDCSGSSGGGGGGGTTTISIEDRYQINDSNLKPCMSKILDSIKKLSTGVSSIIQKFSGNTNIGFNWVLKDGTTINGGPGQTTGYDKSTNLVTSTFNTQAYSNASELSWARTIMHESVHAYIMASFGVDYISSKNSFADFFSDYRKEKYPNLNDAQHAEFVRNYVNDIKASLKEYGNKKGYNLTDEFYTDMAWGGLTHWSKRDSSGNVLTDSSGNPIMEMTPWFQTTFSNTNDRNRVLNTNAIELTKKDMNGTTKTPKGQDAGC